MDKTTQDLVMKGLKLAFDLGSAYVANRNKKEEKPVKAAPKTAAISAVGVAALNWASEFLSKQRENASARVAQAGQNAPRVAEAVREAVQQKMSELPRRFAPEKVEPKEKSQGNPFGSFLAGSMIGAAIGAFIALLYAPQNGRVTRRYARRTARAWQSRISSFAKNNPKRGDDAGDSTDAI